MAKFMVYIFSQKLVGKHPTVMSVRRQDFDYTDDNRDEVLVNVHDYIRKNNLSFVQVIDGEEVPL